MSTFFKYKKEIYPLLAFTLSIFVLIFGLVTARNVVVCSVFLGVTAFIYLIFGLHKQVLETIPWFILIGGLFYIGYYYTTYSFTSAWAMVNRIAAFCVSIIPNLSISATRMCRNLSQIRCPRAITLGMLITMSFMPLLRDEISKIHSAMKTKGATNLLNPRMFYRAFFFPLINRIISISDTLSLSIETRGFSLSSRNYTVYKKEYPTFKDIMMLLLIVLTAVLTLVLL